MTSWPLTRQSLLVRLANIGDDRAWYEFESLYQAAIYRYVRSRGLQEADALEVVQDVMVAVHQAMTKWQSSGKTGSFRAWLAETMRRLTLQALRDVHRKDRALGGSSIFLALLSLEDERLSDGDGGDEDHRWLFMCAAAEVENQVQPSTWKAFWLTAVNGLPAVEAAATLSMSVGTVHTAKCRVLHRIRQALKNRSADPK